MKTKEEVQAAIDSLKQEKAKLPLNERTVARHDALDAQIEVLVDDLSNEEIQNRFYDEEEEEDEDGFISTSPVFVAAVRARMWLDGQAQRLS